MELTDQYAGAKNTLRENVKWLAASFAGVAALILAGTPFSGFGTLALWGPRFLIAVSSMFGAACCLFAVWRRLMFMLRPDAISEAYLRSDFQISAISDPIEKNEIEKLIADFRKHQQELLPNDAGSMEALTQRAEAAWIKFAKSNDTGASRYEKLWRLEEQNINVVKTWASYSRLHRRIQDGMGHVWIFGSLALTCLLAFVWCANPPTANKPPVVVRCCDQKPDPPLPVLSPVLFGLNSAKLDLLALQATASARDLLRKNGEVGLLIVAHTDTTGASQVNHRLVHQRARAVANSLAAEGGIARSRLFIAELPESDLPVITNQEADNAANRSVELLTIKLPARSSVGN